MAINGGIKKEYKILMAKIPLWMILLNQMSYYYNILLHAALADRTFTLAIVIFNWYVLYYNGTLHLQY